MNALTHDASALLNRSLTSSDVAEAHRWQAYRTYFGLSDEEYAGAIHWLLFTSLPQASRADGHAAIMPPFPQLALPRRMWAGGEVKWIEPIAEGDSLTRTSKIIRADSKTGSTGDLLITSLHHQISRGPDVCIDERQDVIFMPAATAPASPRPRLLDYTPDWQRDTLFDEVALFRYSALTFNSHRIHYDAIYAREVEHYPALVVHGPLLASTLIQTALRELGAARPVAFSYRAVAPAFVGEKLQIVGKGDANALQLAVVGADGSVRTAGTLQAA